MADKTPAVCTAGDGHGGIFVLCGDGASAFAAEAVLSVNFAD